MALTGSALIQRTRTELQAAQDRLAPIHRRSAVALAFLKDRQDVRWEGSGLVSRFKPEVLKDYRQFDLMGPLLLFLVARGTSNHPDAKVDHPEAKMVLDLYDKVHETQEELGELLTFATAAHTAYVKLGWSASAPADVKLEDGRIVEQPGVGQVSASAVYGHEVYHWPATAKSRKEVRRLYHVSAQASEDIDARYPKLASKRQDSGASGWLRDVWASLIGAGLEQDGGGSVLPDGMEQVVEGWEYPAESNGYKGREFCIVRGEVASDTALRWGVVPMVPIEYKPGLLSPVGEGPGFKMSECQYTVNALFSRYILSVRSKKQNVVATRGALAFDDVKKITLDGKPSIFESAFNRFFQLEPGLGGVSTFADLNVGEECLSGVSRAFEFMQHICGAHNPFFQSQNLSGVAIEQKIGLDETQSAGLLRSMESFIKARAEIVLRIFAAESQPNVLRYFPTGGDKGQASDCSDLRRLGGRVVVEVGDATLMSPAGEEQEARKILATMPPDSAQAAVFQKLLLHGPGKLVANAIVEVAKETAQKVAEQKEREAGLVDSETGELPQDDGSGAPDLAQALGAGMVRGVPAPGAMPMGGGL